MHKDTTSRIIAGEDGHALTVCYRVLWVGGPARQKEGESMVHSDFRARPALHCDLCQAMEKGGRNHGSWESVSVNQQCL